MVRATILLIEPDLELLGVAERVLQDAGFAVQIATELAAGLSLAAHQHPDLLVLDAALTHIDRLASFALETGGPAPILLTANEAAMVSVVETLEAVRWHDLVHIADVIDKPYRKETLIAAIEKILEDQEARPALDDLILDADLVYRADRHVDSILASELRSPAGQPLPSASEEPQTEAEVTDTFALPSALTHHRDDRLARKLATRIRDHLAEKNGLEASEALEAAIEHACRVAVAEERTIGHLSGEPVALAGYIASVPMDQILQVAASIQAPARCRLERDGQRVDIFMDGNFVVYARQDNLPEGFSLGRILVDRGRLSELQIQDALRSSSSNERRLGETLRQDGLLAEHELSELLEHQTAEIVYETVRWTQGRFSVAGSVRLPAQAEDLGMRIPIHHLLLEGMRRLDEWHRLSGIFGDFGSVVDRIEAESSLLETLSPEQRRLLEMIDGQRTVDELVHAFRRPTYAVVKAISELRDQRLVTVVRAANAP